MILYEIALTLLPGIGDVLGRKLVSSFGSAEEVFRVSQNELRKNKALSSHVVEALLNGRDEALRKAETEVKFIKKYHIIPLYYQDKRYPYRLSNCNDAPVMLYYKGNADLNTARVIGVVGTRRATEYGRMMCSKLIEGMADLGVLVVSGLAFGIDSMAHKMSLQQHLPTVGVLGHGLDRMYPPQNKALAGKMLANGGLLTEFPSQTQPDRENFPRRNRIIAGLCDALVVVEAAASGGALITADIANSYNRDVFAVPGRLSDEFSKGCNLFIKTNRAALIESADDLRYIMGWDAKPVQKLAVQRELFLELDAGEKVLMDLLHPGEDTGIDVLVATSGLKSSEVARALLSLEFKGLIKCLPGKRFKLY